jgi:hypothetical protein
MKFKFLQAEFEFDKDDAKADDRMTEKRKVSE